jgi:ABC-type sugar transport system ATPase subunit
VRPEHLRITDQGPFGVSGVVELVERLGESSFAHIRRADDKMLVVEVRGRETPAVMETVTFRGALQDIHVFDASGQRIDAGKAR